MLSIRRATVGDAAGIARVHVEAWREAYAGIVPGDYLSRLSIEKREAMWRDLLGGSERAAATNGLSAPLRETGVVVALATDGKIVGFADGGATRSPELSPTGELYAIYLMRSHQKSGVGRALYERVVSDLKAAGHSSMMCWVLRDNPTVAFYERMGARRGPEKEVVIGGQPLVELAMLWERI